jgi:hypothetical protein
MLHLILAVALLHAPPSKPPEKPFNPPTTSFLVENPKSLPFPGSRADRIYFAVCLQVAKQVSMTSPPRLSPAITLILGAKENSIDSSHGVSVISLQKWDDGLFAMAVAIAANAVIVSQKRLQDAALEGMAVVNSTVDVEELRR